MTLTYQWSVSIDGQDVSPLVKASGTIDYGRGTLLNGFTAPSARFDMFTEAGWPEYDGTWPTIEKGMEVIIHVTWDGETQWRRHTGVVQAVDWMWDNITVTTVGRIADWQYFLTGSTAAYYPRTAEDDASRAEWLADGADPALTVEASAGRWVRTIPVNTPSVPLLDAMVRLADDCQARLMEDRNGVPRYRTRNFTYPDRYTLPAGVVEYDTLSMSTERGTIVNSVDVYYGEPSPDDGLQPHAHGEDGTSIAAIGERRTEITTDLRYRAGAEGKAAQYLLENRDSWYCPDVTLVMSLATGEEADDLLDLQEGWPLTVTPLPVGCPAGTDYDGDVIGFTEIMHPTDYRMILHLAPNVVADTETPETPIYPDGVITGYESTGTVTDDDDRVYRWVKWSTVGDHYLTCTHTETVVGEIMACAGGGQGGAWLYPGGPAVDSGGGGAGGTLHAELFEIDPGTITVTIGAGAAERDNTYLPYWGDNGGDTIIGGMVLPGGGGGGGSSDGDGGGFWLPGTGQDGGSGGAGTAGGADGQGVPGLGNDGQAGGHGGGAGTGSDGITSSIDGTSREYGRGGNTSFTSGTLPGQGGGGGYGGASQHRGAGGGDGILIYSYRIA